MKKGLLVSLSLVFLLAACDFKDEAPGPIGEKRDSKDEVII